MKISCLYCGHAFGVDDAYCDYEGLLRCNTCDGLMEVRIQDGLVRSARPGSLAPRIADHRDDEVAPQAA
jgi:hypothetical protein